MLVCGCINPPPVDDPEYKGVYFNTNDNMFALAEIDMKRPGGALAAEYVKNGRLGEFSLGYTARMIKCKQTGVFKPQSKTIHELSLVRKGARPGCLITNTH